MTDYPRYVFNTDNQVLIIPEDDLYAGVLSASFASSWLINYGYVFSGDGPGVYFGGNGGTVTNNLHGVIYGRYAGIDVEGDHETITNHGSVTGLGTLFSSAGIFMADHSNHVIVNNDGAIFGRHAGIEAYSSLEGGTINNTGNGVILSDHDGIIVYTKTGLTTTITNGAHATIRGTDHAIFMQLGAMALTNNGKLIGGIGNAAPAVHDVIVNHGTIAGSVDLGGGNDRYDGRGGGVVTGTIYGGPGDDTFFAGASKDTFVFNATAESRVGATRDTIFDFTRGADKINLHWIDADTTRAYDQAFVYIGADTFAHYHAVHPNTIGMIRFDAAHHWLQGNVDATFTTREFEIGLPGLTALGAGDVVL